MRFGDGSSDGLEKPTQGNRRSVARSSGEINGRTATTGARNRPGAPLEAALQKRTILLLATAKPVHAAFRPFT